MLYLEDLNIGDRFISRDYEMTLEEVKQFASLYDPQPFHLDEHAAEQHPIFQGLAASGWHTSARWCRCRRTNRTRCRWPWPAPRRSP